VSSGYLYRQHLNSISFAIPLEIITEYSPEGDPTPKPTKPVSSNEISPSEKDGKAVSSTGSINRNITMDTPETLSPAKASAWEISKPSDSNAATTPAVISDGNDEKWDYETGSKIVLPSTAYSTSDSGSIGFSTNVERLDESDPKLNMIGAPRSGIKVATAPPNIVVVREKPPTEKQIESFSSIVDPPVLTSLHEAIQIANSNLEVNEIWLYDDQLIVEKPIPITAPQLMIRSKGSRRCRIEWKLESSSIAKTESKTSSPTQFIDNQEVIPTKAMFELDNSRLSLQDVDLQISPPEVGREVGRGNLAFVSLAAGSHIKLSNSVVTLLPHDGDWSVSFAFIESKPVNDPPQVELKDTIVRGTGSLIRMEAGTRSELRWSNGLLAVDGWLLETKGGAVASKTPQTVRMDLQDLTIDTKLGLAKVYLTSKESYPLCVSRDAENCTFISSPDSPMISIEGVSWKDSSELDAILPSWIDLRGADNSYDEQINTIVRLQGSSGRTKQIGFEASSMGIFSDRAPETIVPWSNSIDPNKPFDQRIPNDYLQEASTSFRSGMRIDALPSLQ
jgi:hypothetical protein